MIRIFPFFGRPGGRAGQVSFIAFPAVPSAAVRHARQRKRAGNAAKIKSVMYTGKNDNNTDSLSLELFGETDIMSTETAEERTDRGLDEKRLSQLRRLAGRLLDRLEEAIEGEDFSPKELRAYTNTLMDLRQIQMIDPEKLAAENELKLRRMRRDAGDVQARQVLVSFSDSAAEAAE